MNKLEIKGNWNEFKGKLKQKYGEVLDDELTYSEGVEDQIVGVIQEKTGRAKEEIIDELNALKN
ncbi:CsbD family protein [Carboxylicivirga linearis]|uniref:CsbD family protein n=1 Tax=Carboxylicivirga linearis TaxID=1628157 RepID=A0ABS5JXC0_9BACT|nr:CsbD family protein [Carboxylicivirga linearis]MBS2098996.1 CsbD family protein [Carboxylicivirga linearis]